MAQSRLSERSYGNLAGSFQQMAEKRIRATFPAV